MKKDQQDEKVKVYEVNFQLVKRHFKNHIQSQKSFHKTNKIHKFKY